MSVFAVTGEFNGLAVAIFAVVLAITLLITRWAASRTKTTTEFYTAGRGISGRKNGLAIAGDYLSASTFLGYAGLMFLFGFDGWIIGLAACASFIVVLYLLAERMRNAGKFTLADVLSYRLKEKPARVAAASTSLLVTGIYLIAQLVGAGALLQALAGIDFAIAVVICGVFMTIYIVFGGMLATTWIQIIKAAMLMLAGVVIAVAVMAKFSFSPSELLDKAAAESGEGQKFLGPGLYLTTPALVISTGLTIFLGTAGLPHILMRFFTVPDGKAARQSVVWTIGFIGVFTLLVTVIGFGARALLVGDGATEAVGNGGNLAAPLLAQFLGGGEGSVGGDIALALFSAAAFATILAVVSGLVLASASTIAHDLWTNVIKGRGEDVDETRVARIASIGLAVFAMGATLLVGSGFNVTVLVSMAFVFAASANFPALLLALTWRRFNTAGALTGVAFGVIASVVMIGAEPAGVAGPGQRGLAVVVDVPGPRDDPDRLPRLLDRHDARHRRARRRARTTSCSCARRPASAPRARTRAARRAAARAAARDGHGVAVACCRPRPHPCGRGLVPCRLRGGDLVVGAEDLQRVDLGLDPAQPRVALLAVERDRVRGALGEVEVLPALLVRGERGADEREVRLERGHDGRVHRDAGGEVQVLAVEAAQRAARVAPERAADVAQLDHQDRASPSPARPRRRSRRRPPGRARRGSRSRSCRASDPRGPCGCRRARRAACRRSVSISGAERAQRREQLLGPGGVLADRAVDDDDRAAAQELRQLGQRREVHDPEGGGDGVRHGGGPLAPGVHDLAGLLGREHAACRRRPCASGSARTRSPRRRRSCRRRRAAPRRGRGSRDGRRARAGRRP